MSGIKPLLKRFMQKVCYCEDCKKSSLLDIKKNLVCPNCGSRNIKPKKRPY